MENKVPKLDPERIYQEIYRGVYDAMWQMMTNATDTPCKDFYSTIEDAVRNALDDVRLTKLDSRISALT